MKVRPKRARRKARAAGFLALTALVIYSLAHSGPAAAARSLLLPPAVVTNSGTADDQIYNLPSGDGDNQAILEDDGTPGNGMSQLRSGNGSFVTVVFANPANTLTVNAGNDGEKITVNNVDGGFNAKINLNGGTGGDTFALGDGATLKGGAVSGGAGGADTLDYSAYTTPVSVNLGLASLAFQAGGSGIQETPPNAGTANGSGTLFYDNATHQFLSFSYGVGGITPAQLTGLKLRRGAVNAAGPVVVDLLGTGAVNPSGDGFQYSASSVPLPPEQEAALFGGLLYVEVETAAFPGREVRGQITNSGPYVPASATATGVAGIVGIPKVIGGNGNDSLVGSIGDDTLRGGPGDDTIYGGPALGGDKMQGEGDNDSLLWNFGDGGPAEAIDGGAGSDLVNVNGNLNIADFISAQPATSSPNGPGRLLVTPGAPSFPLDIGTVETLTVSTHNGNDTFLAGSLVGVNDLTAVNFNGMFGNDTANITPSATVTFNINGGEFSPPTFPGDLLTLDTTGVTGLALAANNTATGSQGTYTFGNRMPVNFQTVEAVNPTTIKVNDVTAAEGNAGSTGAVFTVSLEAPTNQTVTVDYVTFNGTATAPGDFLVVNGTVTFSPGQTTRFVTVPVNGDTLPEGNETVILNLSNPTNALLADSQGVATITDDDASNIFQFSTGSATVAEGAGSVTLTVTRTGDTTAAASVRYETSDIVATQKGDYTFGSGVVQFAPGQTSRTFRVLLVNDAIAEGAESFAVTLSSPSGNSAVGPPGQIVVTISDDDSGTAPNPIDDPTFFVRQHYLDFLGREPDTAGLNFWVGNITSCGSNPACVEAARVNVSAAFFLSIEFQETSGFVLRTQRVAFGRQSDDPDSRLPYLQFMRDTRQVGAGVVVGQSGYQGILEVNKQAYLQQVVTSPAFLARFPITPAEEYVDALYASAGVFPTPADRLQALGAFGSGGTTGRATALRAVADSASVRQAEFIPSFVLSEYFGYLRRNPTDAPDFNNNGYLFWLFKLFQFNGDFQKAEMVKAFINSNEYRSRFGRP
ncbi:MAG TPA: Calx-beta domain-containing protein [Pyrinomonadaceae bacterium]|nr:Calx-beta domain-containing protein [Pyrinomonadaceae bacterium]